MKYSIMIADDHVMFRQGVKRILEESDEIQVIGEAGDGLELLSLLKKEAPDMVLLDISMPRMRGMEAIQEIKTSHPEVSILILTMHKRKEYLYHSLSAGASGYLLKDDTDMELLSAINTIRAGEIYVSPILSKGVVDDLARVYTGDKRPVSELLTNREREVLKLIAEGKSSKEIAELLFISSRTVQHHRANIMEKLKIKRVADLVKYAIRQGYISETS